MCRIAAYLGPETPLASVLYAPEHSLEVQAYRPRQMVSGTVNVDGTGVAWWHGDDNGPLRYITERPPWSDPNLPTLARRLTGRVILATVRSATPGIVSGPGAVLPFVEGSLAGTHNGYIRGFADGVASTLLKQVPPRLSSRIETLTDSRLLFLLAAAHWHDHHDLGAAAVAAVDTVARACAAARVSASLNLALASTNGIVAIRCARGAEANSLYTHAAADNSVEGQLLASEPLDTRPGWKPVAADHLVTLSTAGVTTTPIRIHGHTAS